MTLDRLVLGAVLALYCLTKCNLDYQDFVYLRKLIRPGKRYMYSKVTSSEPELKTFNLVSTLQSSTSVKTEEEYLIVNL